MPRYFFAQNAANPQRGISICDLHNLPQAQSLIYYHYDNSYPVHINPESPYISHSYQYVKINSNQNGDDCEHHYAFNFTRSVHINTNAYSMQLTPHITLSQATNSNPKQFKIMNLNKKKQKKNIFSSKSNKNTILTPKNIDVKYLRNRKSKYYQSNTRPLLLKRKTTTDSNISNVTSSFQIHPNYIDPLQKLSLSTSFDTQIPQIDPLSDVIEPEVEDPFVAGFPIYDDHGYNSDNGYTEQSDPEDHYNDLYDDKHGKNLFKSLFNNSNDSTQKQPNNTLFSHFFTPNTRHHEDFQRDMSHFVANRDIYGDYTNDLANKNAPRNSAKNLHKSNNNNNNNNNNHPFPLNTHDHSINDATFTQLQGLSQQNIHFNLDSDPISHDILLKPRSVGYQVTFNELLVNNDHSNNLYDHNNMLNLGIVERIYEDLISANYFGRDGAMMGHEDFFDNNVSNHIQDLSNGHDHYEKMVLNNTSLNHNEKVTALAKYRAEKKQKDEELKQSLHMMGFDGLLNNSGYVNDIYEALHQKKLKSVEDKDKLFKKLNLSHISGAQSYEDFVESLALSTCTEDNRSKLTVPVNQSKLQHNTQDTDIFQQCNTTTTQKNGIQRQPTIAGALLRANITNVQFSIKSAPLYHRITTKPNLTIINGDFFDSHTLSHHSNSMGRDDMLLNHRSYEENHLSKKESRKIVNTEFKKSSDKSIMSSKYNKYRHNLKKLSENCENLSRTKTQVHQLDSKKCLSSTNKQLDNEEGDPFVKNNKFHEKKPVKTNLVLAAHHAKTQTQTQQNEIQHGCKNHQNTVKYCHNAYLSQFDTTVCESHSQDGSNFQSHAPSILNSELHNSSPLCGNSLSSDHSFAPSQSSEPHISSLPLHNNPLLNKDDLHPPDHDSHHIQLKSKPTPCNTSHQSPHIIPHENCEDNYISDENESISFDNDPFMIGVLDQFLDASIRDATKIASHSDPLVMDDDFDNIFLINNLAVIATVINHNSPSKPLGVGSNEHTRDVHSSTIEMDIEAAKHHSPLKLGPILSPHCSPSRHLLSSQTNQPLLHTEDPQLSPPDPNPLNDPSDRLLHPNSLVQLAAPQENLSQSYSCSRSTPHTSPYYDLSLNSLTHNIDFNDTFGTTSLNNNNFSSNVLIHHTQNTLKTVQNHTSKNDLSDTMSIQSSYSRKTSHTARTNRTVTIIGGDEVIIEPWLSEFVETNFDRKQRKVFMEGILHSIDAKNLLNQFKVNHSEFNTASVSDKKARLEHLLKQFQEKNFLIDSTSKSLLPRDELKQMEKLRNLQYQQDDLNAKKAPQLTNMSTSKYQTEIDRLLTNPKSQKGQLKPSKQQVQAQLDLSQLLLAQPLQQQSSQIQAVVFDNDDVYIDPASTSYKLIPNKSTRLPQSQQRGPRLTANPTLLRSNPPFVVQNFNDLIPAQDQLLDHLVTTQHKQQQHHNLGRFHSFGNNKLQNPRTNTNISMNDLLFQHSDTFCTLITKNSQKIAQKQIKRESEFHGDTQSSHFCRSKDQFFPAMKQKKATKAVIELKNHNIQDNPFTIPAKAKIRKFDHDADAQMGDSVQYNFVSKPKR